MILNPYQLSQQGFSVLLWFNNITCKAFEAFAFGTSKPQRITNG